MRLAHRVRPAFWPYSGVKYVHGANVILYTLHSRTYNLAFDVYFVGFFFAIFFSSFFDEYTNFGCVFFPSFVTVTIAISFLASFVCVFKLQYRFVSSLMNITAKERDENSAKTRPTHTIRPTKTYVCRFHVQISNCCEYFISIIRVGVFGLSVRFPAHVCPFVVFSLRILVFVHSIHFVCLSVSEYLWGCSGTGFLQQFILVFILLVNSVYRFFVSELNNFCKQNFNMATHGANETDRYAKIVE